MITRSRSGLIWAGAFTVLLGACTHDSAEPTNAALLEHATKLVPQDASDRIVAPDLPWVQISFNVRRLPLEFAIDESRLAHAREEGWSLCQPETSEWEGFEDATVTPLRYTQRKAYILYKDGVLITLFGIYYSASEQAAVKKRDDQTEKPVQHGIVIARKATDKEALEAAAAQGLSCDMRSQDGGR